MLIFTLKLFHRKRTTFSSSKRLLSAATNLELLQKYFGFSGEECEHYINANKLQRLDPKNIEHNIKYCREIGFKDSDILSTSQLLRAKYGSLEQRYMLLEEGGFLSITPKVLAKFISQVRKSIVLLKSQDLIDSNTNVAESFISYLQPVPSNLSVKYNEKRQSWSQVYFQVFRRYLKWRLKVTDKDISNLLLVHDSIGHKSFRYISENITLAENLGFTPDKILKNGYLLRSYPKDTKTILENPPIITGIDMKKAMRMHPKLLTVSPIKIEKIYRILKDFNISDDLIGHTMNIFQLSPETVKRRLSEIQEVADLKVLLKDPYSLSLIVHYNRAKNRLFILKKENLNCADTNVLGSDGKAFYDHFTNRKDVNSVNDTLRFLQNLFQKDVYEFKKEFCKHPFYLHVPFVRMEDTFYHLKKINFTTDDIFNAIYILLYPKEKIDAALNEITSNEYLNCKQLTPVKTLNIILYLIEKEHHFEGNGIWRKRDIVVNEVNSST